MLFRSLANHSMQVVHSTCTRIKLLHPWDQLSSQHLVPERHINVQHLRRGGNLRNTRKVHQLQTPDASKQRSHIWSIVLASSGNSSSSADLSVPRRASSCRTSMRICPACPRCSGVESAEEKRSSIRAVRLNVLRRAERSTREGRAEAKATRRRGMTARETDGKCTGEYGVSRAIERKREEIRTCKGQVRVPDLALRSEVEDRLPLPIGIERVAQEVRIRGELLLRRHARESRIKDEEPGMVEGDRCARMVVQRPGRSEEHTSELQSQ